MNSIAIIIPYFGKAPKYIPFFFETCLKNEFIDFIFFTDVEELSKYAAPNIKINPFTTTEFSNLVSAKLQYPFTLSNGYKLCDLKPMYGKIFEDYISQYNFWGVSDVDIILGDLQPLLTDQLLNEYDIISLYKYFISGPFCLFRNTEEVNTLFEKSADYKAVLDNPKFVGFDEACGIDTVWQIWKGIPILETDAPYESFSHVVLNPEKCTLRLYLKEKITDKNLNKEKIRYNNGHLFMDDTEIYLYHYILNKGNITFNTPKYKKDQPFIFTKNGFFYENQKGKAIGHLLSITDNFLTKAIRKIKRITKL